VALGCWKESQSSAHLHMVQMSTGFQTWYIHTKEYKLSLWELVPYVEMTFNILG
jgi:hypothetical protein